MFKKNNFRDYIVYRLYLEGYTINEIALKTGIPRSSVGHRVKRIREHNPTMSKPIKKPNTTMALLDHMYISMLGEDASVRLTKLWVQKQYSQIKELVEAYFAAIRLQENISTIKAIGEEFKRFTRQETKNPLDEVIDKEIKRKEKAL